MDGKIGKREEKNDKEREREREKERPFIVLRQVL